ncbi:unnamed protein product [Lymnaea stagnalis]|uniref:RNB domain-containing protein n=1 Tax=Lymnaea stagnalis TaxID=6523 RepID=A0AAV2HB42_LYMST
MSRGYRNQRGGRQQKPPFYEQFMNAADVETGIRFKTLIKGVIQVNPRNSDEAYVRLSDDTPDVFIGGLNDRNRAMHSDEVVVTIKPYNQWKVHVRKFEEYADAQSEISSARGSDSQQGEAQRRKVTTVSDMLSNGSRLAYRTFSAQDVDCQFVQRTGKVVYISKRNHSGLAAGRIKLMKNNNNDAAQFYPVDRRLPLMIVPMSQCPAGFYNRPGSHANKLFLAKVEQWNETGIWPRGTLIECLGEEGDLDVETKVILLNHDVLTNTFSSEVERCLPKRSWTIPAEELTTRKDLRGQCIFTIDPPYSKDLDDALSIEELGDGSYQVGVHIADVSYFVEPDTALDQVACTRATSVHMVNKVVHMLPELLSEDLCSLIPHRDKLTFSVIWEITEKGEILNEWFGRTVINSCVQLTYEHAQKCIEEPNRRWGPGELPPIAKHYNATHVVQRILQLNKLADCIRRKRIESGTLLLDQVDLYYTLDADTGLPMGYTGERDSSKKLVEEFMVLANQAVAQKIYKHYPDLAILRQQPAPKEDQLQKMKDFCEAAGIVMKTGSAKEIMRSLSTLGGQGELQQAKHQLLCKVIARSMQKSQYFCTGTVQDKSLYHHYSLNLPFYTDFSSPIRRYQDILVHRLLAAACRYCARPAHPPEHYQKQMDSCMDKIKNAKSASGDSNELFLSLFIKNRGPLEERAIVKEIFEKSFEVLILNLGVVRKVFLEDLPVKSHKLRMNGKRPELLIKWEQDKQRTKHLITLLTLVDCRLVAKEDKSGWSCVIKRPTEEADFDSDVEDD